MTVLDSSLYANRKYFAAYNSFDASVKIGIVREFKPPKVGKEAKYDVEVFIGGFPVPVSCSVMTRFGGTYNFEEYALYPYKQLGMDIPVDPAPEQAYEVRTGDTVLVAFLNGHSREGVILGGIKHPSRKTQLEKGKITYLSQFNGIETKITDSGEYRVTFKGKLLNPLGLNIPGSPIPEAQFDPVNGGSYFSLGDDGSFTVTDGQQQTIKVDKQGLKTTITSGNSSIELGVTGTVTVKASTSLTVNADLKAEVNAKQLEVNSMIMKLNTPKIAIGGSAFELIQGLMDLIDALGELVIMSPVGACSPFKNAPTWIPKVELLKNKMKAFKA
jgi:hypothetical protein